MLALFRVSLVSVVALIHVPALIYLMGLSYHMATATSQSILAVSTTVGVITHLIESHIIFSIAIPTSIGAIFGAQVGARIAKRLKAKLSLAPHEHSCLCIGGTSHS